MEAGVALLTQLVPDHSQRVPSRGANTGGACRGTVCDLESGRDPP